jgi:predicted DNA-binding transcriptional regulator YafY
VLPDRLRRRVSALAGATSTFAVEGPSIDPELLATIAGACRDGVRLRFSYTTRDERAAKRNTEPCAVVHTGYRWYLVAYDLDRDDWRTFRIDRLTGKPQVGPRATRRTVPGGDPAAYVRQRLRADRTGDSEALPGRIRLHAPAEMMRKRIPARYATVEPDGEERCIMTTRGPWSHSALVWTALLGEPLEVLGPPEMIEAARGLVSRLSVAAAEPAIGPAGGR